MDHRISDETMEYVGILAKLEQSDAERETARNDMEKMLDYVDMLNELDTDGIQPMSHGSGGRIVFAGLPCLSY